MNTVYFFVSIIEVIAWNKKKGKLVLEYFVTTRFNFIGKY